MVITVLMVIPEQRISGAAASPLTKQNLQKGLTDYPSKLVLTTDRALDFS